MSNRRIVQGISASWLRFAVSIVIGLFQLPILFANLDKTVLGIYLLFFTVASFLTLADLGLGSVLGRAVSFLWGRDGADGTSDHLEAHYKDVTVPDLIRSGFAAYGAASVLLFGLGVLFTPILLRMTHPPASLHGEISLAWAVFLVGVGLSLLSTVPFSALNGLGDIGWEQVTRVFFLIGRLTAIAVLAPMTHSILALCLADTLLNGASVAASLLLLRFRQAALMRAPGRVLLPLIKHMYREALPIFVTRMGALMILEATPVIVTLTMGVASVPDFMALKQLSAFGGSIAGAVPPAIAPFAASAYAAGHLEQVRRYHSLTLRLTLVPALLWLVGFTLFSERLTSLWLGPGHYLGMAVVVPFALAAFLETHHGAHGFFAWSTGRWPFAPWAIAGGVLTLTLCLAGGHWLGYAGIAAGGMLAQLLTNNWYTVYYTLRRLEVSVKAYLRGVALPMLGMGLLLALLALGVDRGLEGRMGFAWSFRGLSGADLVAMAVSGLVVCLVAVGLTWRYVLTADERAWVSSRVRRQPAPVGGGGA